jgi:hypothetical protein
MKRPPLSLEDRSSTPSTSSSTLDLEKSTFNSQMERYAITLIVILIMNNPRRTAIGGDVDPAVKQPTLEGWMGRLPRRSIKV